MRKKLLLLVIVVVLWIGVSAFARHGYLLPCYGSVLNLIFPPSDLWEPLASAEIEKGGEKYEFIVSHKYPGNHDVNVSIPRQNGLDVLPVELTVTLEIEQDGLILMKKSGTGTSFWGTERQGTKFCRYSFPEDINLRKNALCRVLIKGDIDSLLDQYGDVIVSKGKGSDE